MAVVYEGRQQVIRGSLIITGQPVIVPSNSVMGLISPKK